MGRLGREREIGLTGVFPAQLVLSWWMAGLTGTPVATGAMETARLTWDRGAFAFAPAT